MNTKRGNKEAIKQIIKDNVETLYRLIFLHTKYEEDTKIILEDTICFVADNISKLDYDEDYLLWMYKIAIINTNNFLEQIGMVEKNNKIDNYYSDKIKLYEAIDLLDIKYKNVVVLRCYFELSYEQIAEVLDLNYDTVKIYFRQSLKKIKADVGEYL